MTALRQTLSSRQGGDLRRLVEFLGALTAEQAEKIRDAYMDDDHFTRAQPSRWWVDQGVKEIGANSSVRTWQGHTTDAVRHAADGSAWVSFAWAVATAADDAVSAIVATGSGRDTVHAASTVLLVPVQAAGFDIEVPS